MYSGNDRRCPAVVGAVVLSSALLAAFPLRALPAEKTGEPRLPAVHLDGTYFTRDGKRFIPVGAHWVPAKAALQWPTQWDPKDIQTDFAKMRELGYSLVRFDLLWAWFEPRPGDYNPTAFQQLDFLVSLAHKYRIYLRPSLFIGGEVGEAYWGVPWRHGRHSHTDPDMLVLVNDSAERRMVTVTATLPIHGLRQVTPDGARALALQGSGWQLEIDPWDGVVVEWR